MQIVARGLEMPERLAIPQGRSLHNGNDNRSDCEHGEKGHLEARVKERFGIKNQGRQCSNSQRVQRISLAIQQAREHIDHAHQCRAQDRGSQIGNGNVQANKDDAHYSCDWVRQTQNSSQPENRKRQNRYCHARDDQQVIRAGTLKVQFDILLEQRSFAQDHGC